MGTFLAPGKSEYYFRMMQYLADENVYITDKSLIPYSPDLSLVYVDFYPQLYTPYPNKVLQVWVNSKMVAQNTINFQNGLFYTTVPTPKDQFNLQVKDLAGNVYANETYNAKNYAAFLAAAAQSYEDRRVAIEQMLQDRNWATIRSERIFPVIAAFFSFPQPPGWSPTQYRGTVLGDGNCKPGLVKAFFEGGTLGGVIDGIKSIVGCATVTVTPPFNGNQWELFNNASVGNKATGGVNSWYLGNLPTDIPPPSNRIVLVAEEYMVSTVVATITGADIAITGETVFKNTNSFIQSPNPGTYALIGKNLIFSISGPTGTATYSTTFTYATNATQAALEIIAQNPGLTGAVYASNGYLRIGTAPVSLEQITITILPSTSLPQFGWVAYAEVAVGTDMLANGYFTTPVSLTWNGTTYTQGVDFTVVNTTGEVVWSPSSAAEPNIPPAGSAMTASYTYVPMREIMAMVNLLKGINVNVEYVYS